MKKVLITILSIIMLLTASIGLAGCLNGDSANKVSISSEELSDFYYVAGDSGYVITGLKNESKKDIVVPEGVISIHTEAFKDCDSMYSISLPKSLKEIGVNAFRNCYNLEQVIFADDIKLETINDFAFSECTSLLEIVIPKSVKNMGSVVFEKSNALVIKVEIESEEKPNTWSEKWNLYSNPIIWNCKVNKVANNGRQYVYYNDVFYAVEDNQAKVIKQKYNVVVANISKTVLLNGINYPVGIIEASAFENCEGLLELYIPTSIYSIGQNVIMGARAVVCYVESNVIPSGTQITPNWNKNADCGDSYVDENFAPIILNYKNNTSKIATDGKVYIHKNGLIYSIDLSTNEAKIPIQSFALKEAIFVDYIEYNGKNYPITSTERCVFDGDERLEKIVLPSTLKSVNYKFLNSAKNVEELVVPKSVETINQYSFSYMNRLKSLVFEKGSKLKALPNNAMRGLKFVEKITLPDNLESMGSLSIEVENLTSLLIPESLKTLNTTDGSIKTAKMLYLYFESYDYPEGWSDSYIKKAVKTGTDSPTYYSVLFYREEEPSKDSYMYWCYKDGVPTCWNKIY